MTDTPDNAGSLAQPSAPPDAAAAPDTAAPDTAAPQPDAAQPDKPARKPREYGRIVTRGLMMIVFAIFVALAEYVLILVAVVQFAWMLFTGHPNEAVKTFGRALAQWMSEAAQFQSAVSEDKPFPWKSWPGTTL